MCFIFPLKTSVNFSTGLNILLSAVYTSTLDNERCGINIKVYVKLLPSVIFPVVMVLGVYGGAETLVFILLIHAVFFFSRRVFPALRFSCTSF